MPLFPSKDKRSGYTLLHGHVHLGKRKLMINHWTRTYMTTITIWHSNTIITIIKTTIIIILSLTLSYCFTITCCYYWLFTSVVPCFFPLFSTIFSRNSRKSDLQDPRGSSSSSRSWPLIIARIFSFRSLARSQSGSHTSQVTAPWNKALQLEMRWASLQIHCTYNII